MFRFDAGCIESDGTSVRDSVWNETPALSLNPLVCFPTFASCSVGSTMPRVGHVPREAPCPIP